MAVRFRAASNKFGTTSVFPVAVRFRAASETPVYAEKDASATMDTLTARRVGLRLRPHGHLRLYAVKDTLLPLTARPGLRITPVASSS